MLVLRIHLHRLSGALMDHKSQIQTMLGPLREERDSTLKEPRIWLISSSRECAQNSVLRWTKTGGRCGCIRAGVDKEVLSYETGLNTLARNLGGGADTI